MGSFDKAGLAKDHDKMKSTKCFVTKMNAYGFSLQSSNSSISEENGMTQHLTMHSEGKSYNCSQCDFTSALAVALRKHYKIHSWEKPHKCSQCDYASAHADNLRIHLKRHSGEKSHKCNLCNYASVQASNLRTHLKAHCTVEKNRTNVAYVTMHLFKNII